MSAARIGNYEIVRMLARGGMAVVYLVRQPALDRDVVLKRLDLEGDDPALAKRFVREARLAATLDHPNVVTLFDFFEHDGVPYIAMEYVAGGSLRELVGRLELPQFCGVVEGVLAGLGHAERQGIAHRDLKPENLLLTRRGNVKIADFGIARAYNALTQRLTAPGMAIGTPAYMAPEQATNDELSPSTDLYSLGVIAYELLAGRPPFLSDMPVGLLYAHVHTPPPPLAELVAPEQRSVCDWVQWLLAKDPAARPLDVPACVSEHLRQLRRCAFARDRAAARAQAVSAVVRTVEGVRVLDPMDQLCLADVCPSVIGDVLVYRNSGHLTASFAATLGPWLGARLPRTAR